jgi:hypothetical protein
VVDSCVPSALLMCLSEGSTDPGFVHHPHTDTGALAREKTKKREQAALKNAIGQDNRDRAMGK